MVWTVVTVDSPTKLEDKLNELSKEFYEIVHILTEGPRDGYCYTIVARFVGQYGK